MKKGLLALSVILGVSLVGCSSDEGAKDKKEVKTEEVKTVQSKSENKQAEVSKKPEEKKEATTTTTTTDKAGEEFEVKWNDNVSIDNNTISVKVDTNLKDGTKILYEVRNSGNDKDRLDGQLEVQGGKVTGQLDISQFKPGKVTAKVRFYPFQQTKELQQIYGGTGEKIKGDKVVEKSVGKVVAVDKVYNKR
ncbi:hypothetical protein [Bacillus cereus]|uniref:hypothetical protein n=1 Tax=Bacillus cereus TaxID=1396 RepID=UPI000B4B9718|nr:hypothetical protein [Bacillus cereus]